MREQMIMLELKAIDFARKVKENAMKAEDGIDGILVTVDFARQTCEIG